MFTDPVIVTSDDLSIRSYVKVYIDGKRHRFYNGKLLGINCNPNHCKSARERNRALSALSYKLKQMLQNGWHPHKLPVDTPQVEKITSGAAIEMVLKELHHQDLSALYKRDLSSVADSFETYLIDMSLVDQPVQQLTSVHINSFLKQFDQSATYYMNKRRTLGAIFSRLLRSKLISENPVVNTSRQKEKSTLHQAYSKRQLREVMGIMESCHPNLHLCSLLMYGCFLRPHQEIRQLTRGDFNGDLTSISLTGAGNKSGRVRTVHVPPYVKDALHARGVTSFEPMQNVFTGDATVFNESYFNTGWSRIKETMVKNGLISTRHTLYSVRHTAAVNLYLKTKDLFKVQQAMGHSSMTVTLTYLRSLGLMNNITAEDVPDL